MSLLNNIALIRGKKEHKLGVCIPAHAKSNTKNKRKKRKITVSEETIIFETENDSEKAIGTFKIQGVYTIENTVMLQGEVLSGKISPGLVAEFNEKELSIKEIQFNGRLAEELQEGQKGAIFLTTPTSKLKAGTVLEFFK